MKTTPSLHRTASAFSRVELGLSLAAVGLVACVAVPGLATQRPRFDQIECLNNLRLAGRAFQAWGLEHGESTPWRVPVAQGGTAGSPFGRYAWLQFAWISNQLASPRVLVCPADWGRKMATNWEVAPGGFLNAAYRNNALSYFVGLEAAPGRPEAVLSGDRDLRCDGSGGCSSGIQNAPMVFTRPVASAAWTNGLHELGGNLLLNDGRVLQTTNAGLRAAFANTNSDDNGVSHVLLP